MHSGRLRAAKPRYRGSIFDRSKKVLSSPKDPDWIWGQPFLLFNGWYCAFRGVNAAEVWSWQFISIKLRGLEWVQLPHMPSWCSQGHLYLYLPSKFTISNNFIFSHVQIKIKGLPQQAEVAQGVPGRLRPRIFLTFRHYKGGRSSAKRTGRLYPRRNPWYSFSEAESTSGHVVLSGVPRKNPQWQAVYCTTLNIYCTTLNIYCTTLNI